MSRARRLMCAAALLSAVLAPATADAYYGLGADLISADYERLEQGDDTTVVAGISADGKFAVFQTRARNFFADDDPDPPGQYRAGGIFRFELETRALEKVADGDLFDENTNAIVRRGATSPAVSANGSFVAFATAEQLVPADVNQNVDVYVRDMERDPSDPGAYDLVSARDGGGQAAAYGPPQFPIAGGDPGAALTAGVAISADGTRVVFRTEVASDLPARPAIDVPTRQVFLRDRTALTTTLITTTTEGGAPAGGALGASISGDGTTVAWNGSNAPAQTRFLNGESLDSGLNYYLWKRVADGPTAPTRRVTGVADPDDPTCPPDAVTNFGPTDPPGPCYGPLTEQESLRSGTSAQVPALSSDGYTVAFLTGSGPRPIAFKGPGLDAFVTDMHPGVTRKQGTIELTRASPSTNEDTGAPLAGAAISADGRYVAFTTARTNFLLGTFPPLGLHRSVAGVRELYVIDLAAHTLDRVARSPSGGDIAGDIQPTVGISADGERIAFTAFAGNLFFGDANGRPDAFVATRQADPGTGGPPPIDDGPAGTVRSEDLPVSAASERGGVVRVTVGVPAAGGVKVVADGGVGKRRRQAVLATGTARATGAGTVEIVLRIVSRYRRDLRKRGRISGFATISFVAASSGAQAETGTGVVFRQKLGRPRGR